MAAPMKLGELLISKGMLTKEQFSIAMAQQSITGNLLGDTLTKLGFVSSIEMAQALAEQAGIEFIDIRRWAIPEEVLRLVPRTMAENAEFIPLDLKDGVMSIGVMQPTNIHAIDTASHIGGKPPKVYMVDTVAFYEMMERAYFFLQHPIHLRIEAIIKDVKSGAALSGNTVSSMTELLLMDGIRRNATDIHITPEHETMHVFCRIDGVLQHTYCLPKSLQNGIVSRLKILASLDIAEQRLPQDGSFSFPLMNNVYEMRLSVIPTIHGENVVMRILSGSSPLISMTSLGFDGTDTGRLKSLFAKPHGLILVAGPTGSGKTTTLYSALREINILERNVLTVEDPVEYKLSMIKQTQVSVKTGYDFARAGKSFMRQDPDAMLIGEIRDEETARMAIRASITGHLVLSTIHTNDAPTAIPRLLDLNVDKFLLSSALLAIIAQRLVRKICPHCKEEHVYEPGQLEAMGFEGIGAGQIAALKKKSWHEPGQSAVGFETSGAARTPLFKGKGCNVCNQTGYLGRTVIGEILVVNDEIKELIYSGGSVHSIMESAIKHGMKTMRDNGIRKVLEGIITFEEVLRVVG